MVSGEIVIQGGWLVSTAKSSPACGFSANNYFAGALRGGRADSA